MGTSKQVGSKRVPNPTGKGGFRERPQDRHNGVWKKEDTPRYKLELMMNMSEAELRKVAEDKEAPLFERKLATLIRKGEWKEVEGMINQVYGRPLEKIDAHIEGKFSTMSDDELKKIVATGARLFKDEE